MQVTLCRKDTEHHERKTFKIHKLVAIHFVPNPNNHNCVNHKDENKLNNFAYNLEWCTIQYNNNYGTRNVRRYNTLSKKLRNKVPNILDTSTGIIYDSQKQVSEKLGINYSTVKKYVKLENRFRRITN